MLVRRGSTGKVRISLGVLALSAIAVGPTVDLKVMLLDILFSLADCRRGIEASGNPVVDVHQRRRAETVSTG